MNFFMVCLSLCCGYRQQHAANRAKGFTTSEEGAVYHAHKLRPDPDRENGTNAAKPRTLRRLHYAWPRRIPIQPLAFRSSQSRRRKEFEKTVRQAANSDPIVSRTSRAWARLTVTGGGNNEMIPDDWNPRTDWIEFPDGSHVDPNPFHFGLPVVRTFEIHHTRAAISGSCRKKNPRCVVKSGRLTSSR